MSEQYKKFSDIYEEELVRAQEDAARMTGKYVGRRFMSSLANPILRDYEKMASKKHSEHDALGRNIRDQQDMAALRKDISNALDDAIAWDKNIGLFEDMRQTKELLRLLMARCPGRSAEQDLEATLVMFLLALLVLATFIIPAIVYNVDESAYKIISFIAWLVFAAILVPATARLYTIIKDKIINGKIIPEGRIIFYERYRALIFEELCKKVARCPYPVCVGCLKFECLSEELQDVFEMFYDKDCVKRHEIINKARKKSAGIKHMHSFFDDFKPRDSGDLSFLETVEYLTKKAINKIKGKTR